jgi:cytochrome c oxidase cbb3-type subunit 1
VYYLLPKVIGRPIHSYYLSMIGFWSMALFYNWAGTHHLIGGPLPAWLITVGVIGSLMMFIPVGTTALNHHLTMVGHFHKLRSSPTLRFVVFGAMCYTASSVQGSLESLRDVNRVTHFTHYTVAHAHLGLYGFYTMVMFGAMYYIVPRLTGWEWASARLIRLHFWTTSVGILLYFAVLTWGGWFQGIMLAYEGPDGSPVPFMDIVNYTKRWLHLRSIAGTIITVGHIAFAILFLKNVLKRGEPRVGPTLLDEQPVAETAGV